MKTKTFDLELVRKYMAFEAVSFIGIFMYLLFFLIMAITQNFVWLIFGFIGLLVSIIGLLGKFIYAIKIAYVGGKR